MQNAGQAGRHETEVKGKGMLGGIYAETRNETAGVETETDRSVGRIWWRSGSSVRMRRQDDEKAKTRVQCNGRQEGTGTYIGR